jgi:hypothetical protein
MPRKPEAKKVSVKEAEPKLKAVSGTSGFARISETHIRKVYR